MDYKIIVLDLDGTLTNRDKVITPRTKEALMKAQEAGKIVVLASGRPTAGVEPLAKELDLARFGSYILSYNGGMITNCKTGEVIFSSLLPVESNKKIMDLAKEYGVDFLTCEGEEIITNNDQCVCAHKESKINHLPLRQVDNMEEHVNFPVAKFLLLDDGDYLATIEPKVKASMGKNFAVYRSEPYFLELVPPGIDKARSLAVLLEKLNMKKEEMVAIGDGYNDLSMIKFAGLGVAMGNAQEPVKKAADYITLSNDEDGVAVVVERFFSASK